METCKDYYLGLDIGTDSVGYAVTDSGYTLLRFKGEPMWGTHLFEGGADAAERRMFRTARRRIDRKQQRVGLVRDLFTEEIGKIDPHFFARREESALFAEDTKYGVALFQGKGITDKEYHRKYPTIHHLILELMTDGTPHDVRLVFMACAWLVAHRGHFLFDIPAEQTEKLLDFDVVYRDFQAYFTDMEWALPWSAEVKAGDILAILQKDLGVRKKQEAFNLSIYGGKKAKNVEGCPFGADGVVGLLCGGKIKPGVLFDKAEYADMDAVSMEMDDEEFDRIVGELGDDGELLINLRSLYSCAKLISTMANKRPQDPVCISSSKVAIYEQHRRDLQVLKRLVKTYCPTQYDEIFRQARGDNYVAYSGNAKSCETFVKGADKEVFSDYLKKKFKAVTVREADRACFEDMMTRLDSRSFLPKQKDTDNRVIPQQLYRQELADILRQAQGYLPWLGQKDSEGLTVTDKLLSIFDFRIPYYVGPLVKRRGSVAWIVRKEGKILPWNFTRQVDLDASEQTFIDRMVSTCTYLPGEKVLPLNSLLYECFVVLNAINNLKIDGRKLLPETKQGLYRDLFLTQPRVSLKDIRKYLQQQGQLTADGVLSGLDTTYKGGLKSRMIFRNLLEKGALTESEAEDIILHAAYTEDKGRMRRWLKQTYPQLEDGDITYILRQKLKEFGRLSRRLLCGIHGTQVGSDGEAFTIMEALWHTNCNLMELLSDTYTYAAEIREFSKAYYSDHPRSLNQRLSEMYVSNGVKRSIFRTLSIVSDVKKAMGGAPRKIFVEMARGGTPEQKGKRTKSRKEQLLELYKTIRDEDARRLEKELKDMGAAADNRLQDRMLYLYYLQMGRCMYTGQPISLSELTGSRYNLDHIYPQAQVKDDSILNNLVLVDSKANGAKQDIYPIAREIREKMRPYWERLKQIGLLTEEKYRRLVRNTPFTAEEKMGFINRQLVETRQSTKAIAALLQDYFPETEIVYVKAGLVSEFRHDFELLKCRTVNDLHHAKDAYLNIVVGNVYHQRFTAQWFRPEEPYNVQVKKLFTAVHRRSGTVYWNGQTDLAKVKKMMGKNAVHLTRFAFYRSGGLFDQQPKKKGEGQVRRKKDLPIEKYGGYQKTAVACYLLARFELKKKREIMLVPVELLEKEKVLGDKAYAIGYVENMIAEITHNRPEQTELLLEGRPLKINTVFVLDGVPMTLAGKSNGGMIVILSPLIPLVLPLEWERYAKVLESFQKKWEENKLLQPDETHDRISREKNVAFYQLLTQKLGAWPFTAFPGNQIQTLQSGEETFSAAEPVDQIQCLLNILRMLGSGGGAVDLSACGGSKHAGSKTLSAKLSNWAKYYKEVYILDSSASGLFGSQSENLLKLL